MKFLAAYIQHPFKKCRHSAKKKKKKRKEGKKKGLAATSNSKVKTIVSVTLPQSRAQTELFRRREGKQRHLIAPA